MFPIMPNTENAPVVLIRYLNNFVLTEEGRNTGRDGRRDKWREEKKKVSKVKSSKYLGSI